MCPVHDEPLTPGDEWTCPRGHSFPVGDGWPQLSPEQRREWSILDTYDSLTDVYKHRRSPEQIGRLFDTLPLTDVTVGMEGHVVVGRGRRAAAQGPDGSSSSNNAR